MRKRNDANDVIPSGNLVLISGKITRSYINPIIYLLKRQLRKLMFGSPGVSRKIFPEFRKIPPVVHCIACMWYLVRK